MHAGVEVEARHEEVQERMQWWAMIGPQQEAPVAAATTTATPAASNSAASAAATATATAPRAAQPQVLQRRTTPWLPPQPQPQPRQTQVTVPAIFA